MALQRHIKRFQDQTEVLAVLDVGRMWDRLLGEFLDAWARLERQGLSERQIASEMERFLDDLSTKPLDDIARTSSSVAYNQGRAAEILSLKDRGAVQFVVRSEILDTRTCEACQTYDGAVFEVGTPEFFEFMPPAKCFGGDRCRGLYVAMTAEA